MFLRLYVSIFNESLFQSLYVTIIALILSEKAMKCFIILWLFIVRSALDAVFLWNTKPGFQKYIQLSWFTFVIERPLLFQFSLRQTARLPPFHWGPLRGASLNHAMRASLGCLAHASGSLRTHFMDNLVVVLRPWGGGREVVTAAGTA